MVLWRVTLNDFIFTSVTLIIGRKSDTQWKVFTEHSTTLDLLPDSESHITHVRLLSGHLSNIVGWTDDGRPKNDIVIALPYNVNKRTRMALAPRHLGYYVAATTCTSSASTWRYPGGVVKRSKARTTQSPTMKQNVVVPRLKITILLWESLRRRILQILNFLSA